MRFLFGLAETLGHPNPYLLAASMPSGLLTQWMAYRVLVNSEANPEPTEWDDPETLKRKAAAKATAGDKWRQS